MNFSMKNSTEQELFPVMMGTMGGMTAIIGFMGIFSNLAIAWAIFNKKSTVSKTNCATLIGSLALADIGMSLQFLHTGLSFIVGYAWMPQMVCFLSLMLYILSCGISNGLILMMAIDRYLFISMPIRYHHMKKKPYMTTCLTIPMLLGISYLIVGGASASWDDVVPNCTLAEAMHGPARPYGFLGGLAFVAVAVGLQMACYRRVKTAGVSLFQNEEQAKKEKRLLSSLLIVACVYCLSLVIPIVVVLVLTAIDAGPTTLMYGTLAIGPVAAVNYTCNFFIYFTRSFEYRSEFLRMAGKNPNSVHPSIMYRNVTVSRRTRNEAASAQTSKVTIKLKGCIG